MIYGKLSDHSTYDALHPLYPAAFAFLEDAAKLEPGRYEIKDGMYAIVNPPSVTKPFDDVAYEAHRKYIDIQYVISGKSILTWAPVDALTPSGKYIEARDLILFADKDASFEGTKIAIHAGEFFIAYPEDGHRPNGSDPDALCPYQVIVVKVPCLN